MFGKNKNEGNFSPFSVISADASLTEIRRMRRKLKPQLPPEGAFRWTTRARSLCLECTMVIGQDAGTPRLNYPIREVLLCCLCTTRLTAWQGAGLKRWSPCGKELNDLIQQSSYSSWNNDIWRFLVPIIIMVSNNGCILWLSVTEKKSTFCR